MPNTDIVTTLISGWALLAAAIIAVVTRYGNAFITNKTAPDWITGPLAIVLAGLGALATYLVDVKGAGTWQGALTVFVGALTATKAIQSADFGLEPKLKATGLQLGKTAAGTVSYKNAVDVAPPAPTGGGGNVGGGPATTWGEPAVTEAPGEVSWTASAQGEGPEHR